MFAGQTAHAHGRNRQCVAKGKHQRGRGRRGDVDGTCLPRGRQEKPHIRRLHQGRRGLRGDRDDRAASALGVLYHRTKLGRGAAVRQDDQKVAVRDHAEIAVRSLGRVDEKGGCSGRGERRRDLAGNMSRLADPADDHALTGSGDQRDRLGETVIHRLRQNGEGA